MEEEGKEDEASEGESSRPRKKKRIEPIALDNEEAEIAFGLRRNHDAGGAPSQLEQDGDLADGEEDGDESGRGADVVDDYSGDGHTAGFEDNGVCL